jgi:DNA mismatch repair protein MSH3
MGGKSSYVRQVALICILAQIGSYVPAGSANLGLLDGVYTRMGAHDSLFTNQSTFMVELSETAQILKRATPRSLVILDELGRGTSTHDGVAIAQSVLEHVVRDVGCLCLFVTHYQSLASVARSFAGKAGGDGSSELENVHMRFSAQEGALEGEEEITFLYEVGSGVAHRSYGLNVARLARVPKAVLDTAAQKSREMEIDVQSKKLVGLSKLMGSVLSNDSSASDELLEQFVVGVEQL